MAHIRVATESRVRIAADIRVMVQIQVRAMAEIRVTVSFSMNLRFILLVLLFSLS